MDGGKGEGTNSIRELCPLYASDWKFGGIHVYDSAIGYTSFRVGCLIELHVKDSL